MKNPILHKSAEAQFKQTKFPKPKYKFPSHNFGLKEHCVPGKRRAANDPEEGLLRPKKGRSRGGEKTRKDANNMCHREGEVKERGSGSEAYGHYRDICNNCNVI
jgi:hypothetical protein